MDPVFLHRVDEVRRAEAAALQRLPAGTLMQRAGESVARSVRERLSQQCAGGSVLIVCGPGNNGGDGYAAAAALRCSGIDAACAALAAPTSADARRAAQQWQHAGGSTLQGLPAQHRFALVVDAMFGIGLARPLGGVFLEAAAWINAQDSDVVAIDIPSGLDADRGSWVDGVAGVRADCTITFIGNKPGLHTGDGIDAAGLITVDAIGMALEPSVACLNSPQVFAPLARPRQRNVHKGSFGNVVIVGGAAGMTGAALLAARAALRMGAGRVYVDCLTAGMTLDLMQPELMFRSQSQVPDETVRVAGCGMGTDHRARAALQEAIAAPASLVLDADALNLLADDADLQASVTARRASTILTPHPLEAARLLGITAQQVQQDRIGHARALADRLRAWVVLKGAGSIIAAPQGGYAINPTGSAALSSPGTGDVLAGMLGSLLAQVEDVESAVHAAVWLHGAAADDYGLDVGLVAGEIAPAAARILGKLRSKSV